MKVHDLKIWPKPFAAVANGSKCYEIRINDRNYGVGDILLLREYDPETKCYTGDNRVVTVTYMTNGGEWGLPENMCIMSIRQV